jgi:hypothetical protein
MGLFLSERIPPLARRTLLETRELTQWPKPCLLAEPHPIRFGCRNTKSIRSANCRLSACGQLGIMDHLTVRFEQAIAGRIELHRPKAKLYQSLPVGEFAL